MIIGGLQPFSLLDFPGKIAALVFTQGCNFRCPYCYNPELVLPEAYEPPIPWDEVLSFLKTHQGKIEAIVLSGGEPTIWPDLPECLSTIKNFGYLTKLDTNGSHPEIIAKLLQANLLDAIAMDIKSPLERYRMIARADIDSQAIQKSIALILGAPIWHEFRTTVVEGLLSIEDIKAIAPMVKGAKSFYLQRFHSAPKLVDESFRQKKAPLKEALESLSAYFLQYVQRFGVRD